MLNYSIIVSLKIRRRELFAVVIVFEKRLFTIGIRQAHLTLIFILLLLIMNVMFNKFVFATENR